MRITETKFHDFSMKMSFFFKFYDFSKHEIFLGQIPGFPSFPGEWEPWGKLYEVAKIYA